MLAEGFHRRRQWNRSRENHRHSRQHRRRLFQGRSSRCCCPAGYPGARRAGHHDSIILYEGRERERREREPTPLPVLSFFGRQRKNSERGQKRRCREIFDSLSPHFRSEKNLFIFLLQPASLCIRKKYRERTPARVCVRLSLTHALCAHP